MGVLPHGPQYSELSLISLVNNIYDPSIYTLKYMNKGIPNQSLRGLQVSVIRGMAV